MHFDDRLGTVLRLRAGSGAVRRIQFRQLLDLLGTSPAQTRGEQLDAAYVRLGELAKEIPAAERAAMIGDAGLRLRSPRLVAALAEGEPAVSAAALQRARLSDDQWLDLLPALPPSSRPNLRLRRDLSPAVGELLARLGVTDRGLPPVQPAPLPESEVAVEPLPAPASVTASTIESEAQPEPEPQPVAEAIAEPGREPSLPEPPVILHPAPIREETGIGAIVKRIEAYRRTKQVIDHVPANDSPRLPLDEGHVLEVPERASAFDFATDADGRIVWSDPGVAPMVSGLRIAGTVQNAEFAKLYSRRQPLHACPISLAGAAPIAGEWQLDAAPWFDPLTGHFLGYRGRLRRPSLKAPLVPPVTESPADRMRQMLHELRTPVNAIQVGAEIIQQQLFGATPHEYRALAASIAGDAARMLSAFEELDRLAKLDSGAMELDPGETDLAAVISATVGQLGSHTASRGSGFAVKDEAVSLPVGLARLEVERIAWRLLATLAGISAPGEVLRLKLRERDGMARVDIALPAVLAAQTGDALFEAGAGAIPQVISAGVFGVGFALRLARAEARAAGGDLIRKDDKLRLTLPGLTTGDGAHTQDAAQSAD